MPHRFANQHVSEIHHSGLKVTGPRVAVLRLFQESRQKHWTAEDVHQKLIEDHAALGLATIYRVLMQFVDAGLLTKSHFETGKYVFELNEGHHHDHLVCVSCGRVEEFFDAEIEARQTEVANKLGFELRDHALALYGVCSAPNCRGADAKERAQGRASVELQSEPLTFSVD